MNPANEKHGGESWYDKSVEQLEHRFDTDRGSGLKLDAVRKARRTFGANNIYPTDQDSLDALRRLVPTDFASVLLLAAVLLAMIFDVPIAAGAILTILAVNYGAAVFTFLKARKVLTGMAEYSLPTAKVMREGRLSLIDMRSLVPGDVIFLSAGDIVPADCRIFAAEDLFINEGTLTGISQSRAKDPGFAHFAPNLPLEQQFNMAFASTIVTAGTGRAIVIATGADTAAVRLGKTKPIVTHDNLKILSTLKKYCKIWSMSMLIMVFFITVLDLLIGSRELFDVFLTGLSLAAAAMSELYTAIGLIIVGCGIFAAMKRRRDVNVGALIKNAEKLESIKNLTTLIVPKDGMITTQHCFVEKIFTSRTLYSADDLDRVDKLRGTVLAGVISTGIYGAGLAALSKNSRRVTPEEEAIISLSESLNLYNSHIDRSHPIIEHVPAGEASKFETTLTVDSDKQYMAVCRGDAESILNSCEYYTENGRIFKMSIDDRLEFIGAAASLAKNSYRVVAVATGVTGYNNLRRIGAIQSDLTFEGLIAIREPLQPGVAQVVSRCKAAGIKVIMTTEHYTDSDKYLAMSVGILENERGILTGVKYDSMPQDLLRANLPLYNMYAGVSPAQLSRIVTMMRADGERVGLLAGGMSGALLLKKADVGFAQSVTISPKAKRSGIDIRSRQTPAYSRVAHGSSFDSEALKFISDVVVSDADEHGSGGFSAVVSALEYARMIYKNLLRMVRYLTAMQLSRIFITIGALIMGITALSPIQLVFGGLIVDFAALAASAFSRPPYHALMLRDDAEQTISHPLGMTLQSALFALFQSLCILMIGPVLKLIGFPMTPAEYTSAAFLAFTVCQLVTFAELAHERSIFTPGMRISVSYLLFALGIIAFLPLVCTTALGGVFDVVMPKLPAIIAIFLTGALTLAVNEIYKLITGGKTYIRKKVKNYDPS